ncbi:hypothetical protein [Pseudomonas knackmussii]|uniref:hypothetical protein n=1 Tax=Pseudomonas knackmussii TaxID=65741 RepID=UPI001362A34A|nr:hypothetical protein [Pseudomonas knackmussii]
MATKPAPAGILEGELVKEAVLADWEMSKQNRAREEFDHLDFLLHRFVLPELGGYENPICRDIARHLEQVRAYSGNFCWRHSTLGAAHDAKEVPHA